MRRSHLCMRRSHLCLLYIGVHAAALGHLHFEGNDSLAGDHNVAECGADLNCLFGVNHQVCAKVFYTRDKETTGLLKDFWEATEQVENYKSWAQRSAYASNASWCISLKEAFDWTCQGGVIDRPCDCYFYDCNGTDTCDFMAYDMNQEVPPYNSKYVQECYRSCCKDNVEGCIDSGTKEPSKESTGTPTKKTRSHPSGTPTKFPAPEPTDKPTTEVTHKKSNIDLINDATSKPTSPKSKADSINPIHNPTEGPTRVPSSHPTSPTKAPFTEPAKKSNLAPNGSTTNGVVNPNRIVQGVVIPVRGKYIGMIQTFQQYRLSVNIVATGVRKDWSNIFLFSKADEDKEESRLLALFFYPGTTRLHFRTGTEKNTNEGCDPTENLIFGVKYNIVLTGIQGPKTARLLVHINGQMKCQKEIPGVNLDDAASDVKVSVSSKWFEAAKAKISDLKYEALPELKHNSNLLGWNTSGAIHQGTVIGKINTERSYDIRFKLTPKGIVNVWSNILHIAEDRDVSLDDTKVKTVPTAPRIPGIWFFPGSTHLHVRISTEKNPNDGCDPLNPLAIGKTYDVKLSVTKGWSFSVKLDGKEVCYSRPLAAPVRGGTAVVWVSDPWHIAANAFVRDFFYNPHPHKGETDLKRPLNHGNDILNEKKITPNMFHHVGVIETVRSYNISIFLTVHSTQPGWTNIFHFSTADKIVNGSRILGLWLYPGSSRLRFRTATTTQDNEGCDPAMSLILGRKYYIEIIAVDGNVPMLMVKIDDALQCTHLTSGHLFSAQKPAHIYASAPWHTPANVTMERFVYNRIPRVQAGKNIMSMPAKLLKKGNLLGFIDTFDAFKLSFNLRPKGTVSDWGSVLHFSSGSDDVKNAGRIPAIWFYPGKLRLHVRMSTTHGNEGCDPSENLKLNINHKIELYVSAKENSFTVHIDGKPACYYRFLGTPEKSTKNVKVYASDPFFRPAKAVVTNVVYTKNDQIPSTQLAANTDLLAGSIFKPVKGRLLGNIDTKEEYRIGFDLVALDTDSQWSSIFHITTGKDKKDGGRIPGLWFYPGTLQLHYRQATTSNEDQGCDPAVDVIKLGKKHHIEILSLHSRGRAHMMIEVDGKQECYVEQASRSWPSSLKAKLWMSDPWYNAASVKISKMFYYTIKTLSHGKDLLDNKQITLSKGNFIGKIETSTNYRVSFDLTISNTQSGWSSIVHFTADRDLNNTGRLPGFWLHPGSTRLQFRTSTNASHNDGCDPDFLFVLNQKYNIEAEIVSSTQNVETIMTVKIDGIVMCYTRSAGVAMPGMKDMQVWAGDPWHPAAKATLGNLQYEATDSKYSTLAPLTYGKDLLRGYEMTLNRGAMIGPIVSTKEYTISFKFKAQHTHPEWNSILQFMANPDGSPSSRPGIWLYPGTTRLHLRSGTDKDYNEGCDPSDVLIIGRTYNVEFNAFQSSNNVFFIVRLNGEKKCFRKTAGNLPAGGKQAKVFLGSASFPATHGTISNLVYNPIARLTTDSSDWLNNKSVAISSGKVLGKLETSVGFKISLELTPIGTVGSWANILHITENDDTGTGGRIPGIWFHPGTTRLHFRHSSTLNINDGCDPIGELQLNKKAKIDFIASPGGSLSVRVDDKEVCYKRFAPNMLHGATKSAIVYLSNPWHLPAKAEAGRLAYSKLTKPDSFGALVPGKDLLHGHALKPSKGATIGTLKTSQSFRIKFKVTASATIDNWASLFLISNGNSDGGLNGRTPAVFFHPGSTRLHFRTSNSKNYNDGCDPSFLLQLNLEYEVEIIALQGATKPIHLVRINNELVCYYASPSGVLAAGSTNAAVYVGYPLYPAAEATLNGLSYLPMNSLNYNDDWLNGKTVSPSKGSLIGWVKTAKNYQMSFCLLVKGTVSDWSNIVHLTAEDDSTGVAGSRVGAVWLFPGDTRLHFVSQTTENLSQDCDPTEKLKLNMRYNVFLSVRKGHLVVKLNHKQVCKIKANGTPLKGMENVQVWASDPWYRAAHVEISSLRYRQL